MSLPNPPDRLEPDIVFPPYSYVPGLFPHPHSDAAGHCFRPNFGTPNLDDLANDRLFRVGIDLFNAGYYWEAHEAWETLWHVAGRRGPVADLCKGLIQLAVVGVKIRQGREDGVRLHARRAGELFANLGSEMAGLNVEVLRCHAIQLSESPPQTPAAPRQPIEIVFDWRI